MNKDDIDLFRSLDDYELLAVVLMGEARGEPIEGRIAVGCVIRNRVQHKTRFGKDYKTEILRPWQFSCFNEKDLNLVLCRKLANGVIAEQALYQETRWIALGIVNNTLLDLTLGADHYHHKAIMPWWRKSMQVTAIKGNHIFCKEA